MGKQPAQQKGSLQCPSTSIQSTAETLGGRLRGSAFITGPVGVRKVCPVQGSEQHARPSDLVAPQALVVVFTSGFLISSAGLDMARA